MKTSNVEISMKMMVTQDVETFLQNLKSNVVLDIRPLADYQKGHVPNAINLPFPIRLNALRKEYRQAVDEKQLCSYIENAAQWKVKVLNYLKKKQVLYVYCQAGGLRSFYFNQLLNNFHGSLVFLKGGYDSFRSFQLNYFKSLEIPHLYVLKGKTGCGKTEIIRELKKLGKQILPFADIARHRGSAFGSYPQTDQPTSAQFQHNLLQECLELDLSKPVFVEEEGAFIGSVNIPESLFSKFQSAKTILLKVPKTSRLTYLVGQYADSTDSGLIYALKKIESRLAAADFRNATTFLLAGRRRDFVSLLLDHYDRSNTYRYQGINILSTLELSEVDPFKTARLISAFVEGSEGTRT
ncbi:MAG: hypothetical protein KJN76_14120 [Eudoraea sp.]|nr:hypothetical protein [Eudoraea sp.]